MPLDDEDWIVPDAWYTSEADLFFNMVEFGGGDAAMLNDDYLQMQFDAAYFRDDITPFEREMAREALHDYLMEEYDVDFDDAFDWEHWRESYGVAA